MSKYQWALTFEFLTLDEMWVRDSTRFFPTQSSALRFVKAGERAELKRDGMVRDGDTRFILGRVSCPWGVCPACGSRDLYDGDSHVVDDRRCHSPREPLVGRRVRVATIDGRYRGYGIVALRDGYSVLHVHLNGGPQIPVGDEEFELLLPGFSAHGITFHRIGETWADV